MFILDKPFLSGEVNSKSRWEHDLTIEKVYMVTFNFKYINIGCYQHLLPFTLWKVGLVAIAKCLLVTFFVCAHRLLYLPPLIKNESG